MAARAAPPTLTAMPPQGTSAAHRLDVQALRGIAVLAVVAFHAGLPLHGGFLGVDLFFVVSGYVITGLILREAAAGTYSYPRFLGRRFLRLAPALALVVVVTCLLGLLLLAPTELPRVLGLTGLAAQASGANLALPAITGGYFGTDAESNPLLHTWSLGVEEQFYLFFGLAAAVVIAVMRERIRLGLAVLSAVVVAGSLAVALTPLSDALGWGAGFYGPLGRAWELGAGVLLALAAPSLRVGRRPGAFLRAGGLLVIALSLVLIDPTSGIPGPVLLVPVLATVALLAGGLADPGLLARQRWLIAIGDRSYALYLWHWPLLVVAAALPGPRPVLAGAAVALAVVAAWWSTDHFEAPLRRRQVEGAGAWLRIVAATVVPPMLLSAALLGVPRLPVWPTAAADAVEQLYAPRFGDEAGCYRGLEPKPAHIADCTDGAGRPGRPVYLVGDSQAWMMSSAVRDAAEALDRPFTTLTYVGCPWVVGAVVRDATLSTAPRPCSARTERVLDRLDRLPDGLVVIAMSDAYWTEDRFRVRPLAGGTEASTVDGRAELLDPLVRASVQRLRDAGHEVLLLDPIPHLREGDRYWDGRVCGRLVLALHACTAERSADDALAWTAPVRRLHADLAEQGLARRVDPVPVLCPDGMCRTLDGSTWVYRDGAHLTVVGASRLVPLLTEALAAD